MFLRFIAVVNDRVRKPEAVEFMCRAWDEMNEKLVRKAAGIHEEPDDSPEPTDAELLKRETEE
jgi:hypothetical protein